MHHHLRCLRRLTLQLRRLKGHCNLLTTVIDTFQEAFPSKVLYILDVFQDHLLFLNILVVFLFFIFFGLISRGGAELNRQLGAVRRMISAWPQLTHRLSQHLGDDPRSSLRSVP